MKTLFFISISMLVFLLFVTTIESEEILNYLNGTYTYMCILLSIVSIYKSAVLFTSKI